MADDDMKKLDALIATKIDSLLDEKLKPIVDKLAEQEDTSDKTDANPAVEMATNVLKAQLKGIYDDETTKKLDSLSFEQLYLLSQFKPKTDGIRNPIEQKDQKGTHKTDSKSGSMWDVVLE